MANTPSLRWARTHTYKSNAFLSQFVHQDEASEDWKKSPLKYLIDNDLNILRRELTGDNKLVDFELLEGLEEAGYTDFISMRTKLEGISFRSRDNYESNGILVTWATNAKGGFSDNDLIALQKIERRFAVTCKIMIQSRIADNVAKTYLGARAGGSVMKGQIRQGDGQRTNAVIWYTDLRNSTRLAETMPADDYYDLLNSYFNATAQPIIDHGGEILDFIGDAVLGIFPYNTKRQLKSANQSATAALVASNEIAVKLNGERVNAGKLVFNYGIGLNVGEVMFGNIGIPSRLSFSVIGPAVNEAARIENMTKEINAQILAGPAFASIDPQHWSSIGLKRFEGVSEPIEIFEFTPD